MSILSEIAKHVGHSLKTTKYTNGGEVLEIYCETCKIPVLSQYLDGEEGVRVCDAPAVPMFEVKVNRKVVIVGGFSEDHVKAHIEDGGEPDVDLGVSVGEYGQEVTASSLESGEIPAEFDTLADAGHLFGVLRAIIDAYEPCADPMVMHQGCTLQVGDHHGGTYVNCANHRVPLIPTAYVGVLTTISLSYGTANIDDYNAGISAIEEYDSGQFFEAFDCYENAVDALYIQCPDDFLLATFGWSPDA